MAQDTEQEKDQQSAAENLLAEVHQSDFGLNLEKLNRILGRLAGSDYRMELLSGDQVSGIGDDRLRQIAECYKTFYNQNWNENWTVQSAYEELDNSFRKHANWIQVVCLLHKGRQIVGLCWAVIANCSENDLNGEQLFASRLLSRKSNQVASDWLKEVGGKNKVVYLREVGVLKQYAKVKAPLLCFPVFKKALDFQCKFIFLRTKVTSQALKWSQGMGFSPLHYFVVNELLLMLGSLQDTVKEYEFMILDYFAGRLSSLLDRDRNYEEIMQQTVMDHAEKLQVMQSLSANIAHEMRTPLSGIRASISGVETYLPELLWAYRKQQNLETGKVSAIREDHLQSLEKTPERIMLMIDQANAVIDMLLMNLRENSLDRQQLIVCSAADCVRQAIDRYPFRSGEREKVNLDLDQDFYFKGIDSLFIYVLFNLLKNSLYSISSALKGDITITLKKSGDTGRLVFRDTGEGIEPGVLDRVFEGFFTTREEGTGVGLAFCKRTINSFNGEISCLSQPGEFAEFTITLPAS